MPPWLPFVALGLVAGACVPDAPGWWTPAGVGVAVAAVAAARWLPLAGRWLAFAAAALIGGPLAAPAPLPVAPAGGRLVELTGTVARVQWQSPYSQGFRLDRLATDLPADWPPPERLFVKAPALPGVRDGDAATVRGVWSLDGWGERVDAVQVTVVPREAGPRGAAWRAVAGLDEHRELAATLLLGRGDPPERATFRAAGLAHILAVSGMHLAIAAGLGWWLLRAVGVGWGMRLAALAALLIGYTWLTYANPATLRACVMAVAVLLCQALMREPHRLAAVSLAALALVAWEPAMARDIGFQLSLAAVLGIVTLGLDLIDLRKRALPLAPWPLDRPAWRLCLWGGRALVDGAAIGLAATLATMPLIAWHFGQAAPWAWLTSLAAGIPATVALWAGLPLIAASGLWPGGPWDGLYRVVEGSLGALTGCAAWGARHLPQEATARPAALLLCLWPLLFLRLRDGWDLLLRALALGALLLIW